MTKKELQEQIYQELEDEVLPRVVHELLVNGDDILDVFRFADFGGYTVLQKRPYTVVHLSYIEDKTMYQELTFSKVCYPDRWNAPYGVKMCLRKASANLARRILAQA